MQNQFMSETSAPPAPKRSVPPALWATLFFAALYLIVFSPVLGSGRLLAPADGVDFYLPNLTSSPDPWTPHTYSGFPAFADPQEMRSYPLRRLLLDALRSWNLFVLSGFVLASLFQYLFVRSLTQSHVAGLFAGVAFGLSGFFLGHLRHIIMLHTALWIPLSLLAVFHLRARLTGRWLATLGGSVGCAVLAGHPQVLVYLFGALGAYVLWNTWRAPVGPLRFLGACATVGTLGLGIGAVQWVPLLELTSLSVRADLTFAEFVTYALPVDQLAMILVPYAMGGLDGPYVGAWSLEELSSYVGMGTLLLALIAISSPLPGLKRETVFFTMLVVFSGVAALGDATPLGAMLYQLPGYQVFRAPARHFVEFALAASVLGGLGLATLVSGSEKSTNRRLAIVSTVVGLLLALSLITAIRFEPMSRVTNPDSRTWLESLLHPAYSLPILLFVLWVAAIANGTRTRPEVDAKRSPISRIALVVLLVVDLGAAALFAEWRRASPDASAISAPDSVVRLRETLAPTHQRFTPLWGSRQPLEGAPPNRSRLWEVPSTSGFNPLCLERYGEFLGIDLAGVVPLAVARENNRTLDLLAVRYVQTPLVYKQQFLESPRWKLDEELSRGLAQTCVFENRTALPRAWLASSVLGSLPPEKILSTLRRSRLPDGTEFDPRQVALIEEALPKSLKNGTRDPEASVSVRELQATRIVVEVTTREPAFLVLSDVHYPGWQARIDEEPQPIIETYTLLRGVAIQPGEHVVTFEFKPASQTRGGALSLASIALLMAVGITTRLRNRSHFSEDSPEKEKASLSESGPTSGT